VLGELARQDEADGGLHVAAAHGRALVDAAQLGGLRGDLLERVGDEVVDDRNALLGDARLRVDLLHHLEDVAVVALDTLAAPDRLLDGVLLAGSHGEKVVRLSTQTTLESKLHSTVLKSTRNNSHESIGNYECI
jgi:hypothetical protein